MTIWFIVLWTDEDMRSTVECQRHDWPKIGFETEYKAIVRRMGGRVLAVVRLKRNTVCGRAAGAGAT